MSWLPQPTEPTPEFGFERGIPPEQKGAREQEFYPERTRSIHQPAFVKGAARTDAYLAYVGGSHGSQRVDRAAGAVR